MPDAMTEKIDFVDGMKLIAGAGDPQMKSGLSIYNYVANASMEQKAFYNSDGDFLIVPQLCSLMITTEFGKLFVEPQEIIVIQRGIRFSVALHDV